MRIIGCDLHARQQTIAMLDTTTGEIVKMTLTHEDNNVREFYSALPRPACVGIEATGSMQWFVNLMEELGIECRVGNPAKIRCSRWNPWKQKHDRRDADLILTLLVENRFPAIWLPSKALLDLRALLGRTVIRWVRMRTRIQECAGEADCLSEWLAARPLPCGAKQANTPSQPLPLAPHTGSSTGASLQALYVKFDRTSSNQNQR